MFRTILFDAKYLNKNDSLNMMPKIVVYIENNEWTKQTRLKL